MLIKEVTFFVFPLLVTGIIHHFIIIKYDLFAFLAKPIDFGLILNKNRVFGNSKTFRGFIIEILFTGLFMSLTSLFLNVSLKNNVFISGAILGLGYSLGELPNSFLKRRMGIKESTQISGSLAKLFYILDHTDSIIGTLILLPLIYSPSIKLIITLLFVGTLLHALIDKSLYKFSYKNILR